MVKMLELDKEVYISRFREEDIYFFVYDKGKVKNIECLDKVYDKKAIALKSDGGGIELTEKKNLLYSTMFQGQARFNKLQFDLEKNGLKMHEIDEKDPGFEKIERTVDFKAIEKSKEKIDLECADKIKYKENSVEEGYVIEFLKEKYLEHVKEEAELKKNYSELLEKYKSEKNKIKKIVFKGKIRILSEAEVLKVQKLENPNPGVPLKDTCAVLILDDKIDKIKADCAGPDGRNRTIDFNDGRDPFIMILLDRTGEYYSPKIDEKLKKLDGKDVLVETGDLGMPSDTSIPLGQPRDGAIKIGKK